MENRVRDYLKVDFDLNVARRLRGVCLVVMLFLSIVSPGFSQSQSPDFVSVAPDVLSNSYARCFFKDSKGYMWIGTEDALIRYDGTKAYRYVNDPENHSSIAHNTINTIIEGPNRQLWIGTAQGLCIYNRELDNFINVDSIKGNNNFLNNRYITDLVFDTRGHLWIGTHEGGINIYDPVNRKFDYIIDPPIGGVLPSSNFINILEIIDDTVWCATKGGLLLYDIVTKKRLPLRALNRFAYSRISAIVREKSGDYLIATITGDITRVRSHTGMYNFEPVFSGDQLGESFNRILSMALDEQGDILIGGENSGFNIIDQTTNQVHRFVANVSNGKGLPGNSVEEVYVDDRGLIWIGTFNNGVYLLDNKTKKFDNSEGFSLQRNDVRSLAEDAGGNIWVASYGVGLSRIDSKTGDLSDIAEINRRISNKNVTSVICDRQGQVWLGTAGRGVYRIDPKSHQLVNYSLTSEGFGNDQVFCLFEDARGVIWAGTWGSGLFYRDPSSNKFVSLAEYDQPNHIPNTGYITDILEDSTGTLWVGTLYGLYELNKKSEYQFAYRAHLPDNNEGSIKGVQVHAIVEDENGDLWIGTTDGLNLRKKGSSHFTTFETARGAMVNTIRSILVDQHGHVWMAGNAGLSRFEPASGVLVNYTREDGLKSNNFQRKAALKSSTGRLFFGSNNGLDSFYPDCIRTNISNERIVLSDLRIGNQSVRPGVDGSPLKQHVSLTSDMNLSYDQRSFVIDFVVLDHSQSSNYTYCYMLEGFDDDWNCSNDNNSATYTNIDPGNYVFLVKAANRDGVSIGEPLRLEITIEQIFWKTWWAFFIYAVLLVSMVYFVLRIRLERLKLKNEIALEKLRREQEQKLGESKTQFFTNVAHEFRTPLSLIMIPLESLMGTNDVPAALRERIYTAYKSAFRMNRLVNELLDFNKLEGGNLKLNVQHGELGQFILDTSSAFDEMAAKRGLIFSVNVDTPTIVGWFDRDKLERIIFNILSNAFKFTADAGEIKLNVSTKQSIIPDGSLCRCVELVIEDNGIGISPEELPHIFEKFYQAKSSSKISSPGTGIGLSLTKALVELHRGTITVTSVPDQATIFTILLPIDAGVYEIDESVEVPPEVVYINKYDDAFSGETPGSDRGEPGDEKPRILIVEDNVELREYLVSELRRDFAVLEAKDGAEGLAISLESNPDLIISDIMMPVKSGIELCHDIKSDLNTSHIPFILLTAKATVEDQITGIEKGADLYVPKPFNIRYLITHVNQLIRSRRELYARFSQDVYLLPAKATTNTLDQEFLQKAIDYISANLQDPQLSVDSIAAVFNLSRMQMYRKIKAVTGKSVVEFIRMVRMKQAIKLMDSRQLTLSEVAFEVGFNSASYFTRCFKEEYGKTPSEYLEG